MGKESIRQAPDILESSQNASFRVLEKNVLSSSQFFPFTWRTVPGVVSERQEEPGPVPQMSELMAFLTHSSSPSCLFNRCCLSPSSMNSPVPGMLCDVSSPCSVTVNLVRTLLSATQDSAPETVWCGWQATVQSRAHLSR